VRPTYETAADLANEAGLLQFIAERAGCTAHKIPKRYHSDHAMVRGGEVVAFVEAKCRTFPSTKFPTYMLSLEKVLAARAFLGAGKNAFLAVRWSDNRVATVNLARCVFKVVVGGRTDRGDPDDIEPVAMIPLSEFKFLTGVPDA
jgi:hypothetical protein